MTMSQGLAATWCTHVRVRVVAPEAQDELEQLLGRTFDVARAAWPSVDLPAEQFVRHLAERLSKTCEGSRLEALLGQLQVADLYLACACAAGIPTAIAAFEQHYLAKLPARLRQAQVPAANIDDVCQMVREKLLVRTDQGEPHIGTYSGEGELQNFTYVIGVRFARKLRGADKPAIEEDVDAALEALPVVGADVELDLIKRGLLGELRQAVRAASSALSTEERHLLKLHYVRRLSTTKLGALFGVNQSTVSRRLEAARQTIYKETKRILQERLRLSGPDLQGLVAALDSQLDMSLSLIFGEEEGSG